MVRDDGNVVESNRSDMGVKKLDSRWVSGGIKEKVMCRCGSLVRRKEFGDEGDKIIEVFIGWRGIESGDKSIMFDSWVGGKFGNIVKIGGIVGGKGE